MYLRRRLTAALLCALLALTLCVPAMAEDAPPAGDSTLYVGRITGIVRDSEGGAARLTITSEAGGAYYTLLISPSTVWVDAAGRKADSAADLKEGELIYATCAPQSVQAAGMESNAADLLTTYVVTRNIAEDSDHAFYQVVSDFSPEKNGGWRIDINQEGMYFLVNGDTTFTDYTTGETLPLSTIEIGDRIMAWYGSTILTIYPAQVWPSHLMRLPREEENVPAEGAVLSLVLGGDASELKGRYENGTAMVPVAAAGQALGLKTTYVKGEEGRVVTVESDTFAVTLAIDQGLISGATRIEGALGATGPLRYGKMAYIESPGTTWAPAELFAMLGQTVTLEGTQLTIKPM